MEDIENNLLTNNKNVEIVNVTTPRMEEKEVKKAPDGGTRAWLVLVGSFFCNGILFGVINSYGVLYTEIQDKLTLERVTEASSKAGE